MAGFWLISEGENSRRFGRICNKTGGNTILEPRMDTNRHEYPRRELHASLQILSCGIQSLLIPDILVCKVCDSWSFMPISMKVSTACAICSERPFSSAPRDAGVGRG